LVPHTHTHTRERGTTSTRIVPRVREAEKLAELMASLKAMEKATIRYGANSGHDKTESTDSR